MTSSVEYCLYIKPRAKYQNVNSIKMEEIRKLLVTGSSNKPGIAIVVGMCDTKAGTGVPGAEVDMENMEKAFKKLNFAVLTRRNPNKQELLAIVQGAADFSYLTEAPSCQVIAFYFAGHGGCDNDDKQLFSAGPLYAKTSDSSKLHIEAIASPFYPEHAEHLKYIKRLFFFDMCLGKDYDYGTRSGGAQPPLPTLKYAVPAKGNCLMAFSGSHGYRVRGDETEGGFWTRHLHKSIVKDVDIYAALAETWTDTVRFSSERAKDGPACLQGPCLFACMGPLNLTRKHIATSCRGGFRKLEGGAQP